MRRADRHLFDAVFEKIPALQDLYWRQSARLKRLGCLAFLRAGRLTPSGFVLWVATHACNYGCPICEASAGVPRPGELTAEEAMALFADVKRIGARRLIVSGGEPLLRQDIPLLLEYAARLGLSVGLLSNGSLIERRWAEIRSLPFFLYMTSLDGPAEFHDQARRSPGAFGRVLRSLELFGTAGTPLRTVKTVVQPGNIALLERLRAVLRDSGATDWTITPAFHVGRAAHGSDFDLSSAQLHALVDFVREHQGETGPRIGLSESHSYLQCLAGYRERRAFFCGAGLTRCAVMANGDVLGCGQSYESGTVEGNIRTTPLSELWRHGFRRYRELVQPEGCQGCEYWNACQGGCAAAHDTGEGCLKAVWTA